jgi:hypothetical protein
MSPRSFPALPSSGSEYLDSVEGERDYLISVTAGEAIGVLRGWSHPRPGGRESPISAVRP